MTAAAHCQANYAHLSEGRTPYFYVPLRQVYRPEFLLTFYVRASGPTEAAIAALRREAKEAGPSVPLFGARSLRESIGGSTYRDRTAATLMSLLAGIAFPLAAIGLYGVSACSVAQRTGEIGLRMALGARRFDVVGLVVGQAARLMLAGLATGLVGGALLARSVEAMLFSVSPADPRRVRGGRRVRGADRARRERQSEPCARLGWTRSGPCATTSGPTPGRRRLVPAGHHHYD